MYRAHKHIMPYGMYCKLNVLHACACVVCLDGRFSPTHKNPSGEPSLPCGNVFGSTCPRK